jgi:MFS family permease
MLQVPESMPEPEQNAQSATEPDTAAAPQMTAAPVAGATHRRSLWRHADYVKLWSAATVSQMGSQVSLIAIPFIAAAVLQGSALQVSLLAAVEMLPFILFALPAGAWLDRVRRRPVLIAGDFGRAAALLSIPLAYFLGHLTIWQLYAVAFTTGFLTVLFDVADQSYLPVLLEAEDLVDGNAKLQISASAAQILGPGFGGGLIALVAAPFAVIVDAVSFLASGGLLSLIRTHEQTPERNVGADGTRTSLRQEIAEGLRYVVGNRYLRMIAGSTATSNLGTAIAFSIFPIFAYVELGLSAAVVGTAFSIGGTGVLLGAVLSAPLARRFGIGAVIVGSMFVTGPATLVLVLIPRAAVVAGAILAASGFLMGFTAVAYNVNQVSFRQAITPLEMQGRMNATMRFIVWGTMPLGSVIGGILGSFLPLRATILVGGIVASSAFLWVLLSPVRSLHEIPKSERAERAERAAE